jgi:hypothetical protein
MERAAQELEPEGDQPDEPAPKSADARTGAKDRKKIEQLFEQAEADRRRAYELKQELDRLGLFHEFEDRFLDLFKEP